jgi:hypothetical protein
MGKVKRLASARVIRVGHLFSIGLSGRDSSLLQAFIAKTQRMFDDGFGTVTRRPGVWKPLQTERVPYGARCFPMPLRSGSL